MPLPAALGLVRVLPFCVVGPRSWAGSPSWSVPFGLSRCYLRCYIHSHYCVSLQLTWGALPERCLHNPENISVASAISHATTSAILDGASSYQEQVPLAALGFQRWYGMGASHPWLAVSLSFTAAALCSAHFQVAMTMLSDDLCHTQYNPNAAQATSSQFYNMSAMFWVTRVTPPLMAVGPLSTNWRPIFPPRSGSHTKHTEIFPHACEFRAQPNPKTQPKPQLSTQLNIRNTTKGSSLDIYTPSAHTLDLLRLLCSAGTRLAILRTLDVLRRLSPLITLDTILASTCHCSLHQSRAGCTKGTQTSMYHMLHDHDERAHGATE